MGRGRLRQPGIRALLGRRAARLLVVTAFGGIVATPVLAASANPGAGRIGFYGDIGNIINSRNPLLVRPSTLLLTEDGSVALVHLRWSGWGTSVARATGVWSASDGIPDQATGKRTTSPARLTLSRPGSVLGRMVYRCFEVTVPSRPRNGVRECLQRRGNFCLYAPVTGHAAPPRDCATKCCHLAFPPHMLTEAELKDSVTQGRTIVPQAVAGAPALGDLTQLPGTWSSAPAFPDHGWSMIALPFMQPGNIVGPDIPGQVGPFRLLLNQFSETLTFTTIDQGVPNRGAALVKAFDADQHLAALQYL